MDNDGVKESVEPVQGVDGGEQGQEGGQVAPVDQEFKIHVQASHREVDIVCEKEKRWAAMGFFITWKCTVCGVWRVPGAPFQTTGDKRCFLETCSFGDTSKVCCNCERMREVISWRARSLQIERKGLKLLDPPIRLVDVSSREVVWDKEQDSMEMYKEILKEGVFEESGSERTRWYAEMACNHCRHRAGLMTHEEIARKRAVQAAILLQEAQGKKGKGKGGKKKK